MYEKIICLHGQALRTQVKCLGSIHTVLELTKNRIPVQVSITYHELSTKQYTSARHISVILDTPFQTALRTLATVGGYLEQLAASEPSPTPNLVRTQSCSGILTMEAAIATTQCVTNSVWLWYM